MGLPIFRFRLIHETAGTFEISEPDGWKDAKLRLERHEDFHSLVEFFSVPLIFYGDNGQDNGGVNVIRYIEQTYGFDTDLIVKVDASFDSYNYEDIYTGLYDFTANEETNKNKIKSAIIRNDFWSKFVSRKDTPIDLLSAKSLDDTIVNQVNTVELNLTSQKVPMTFQGRSVVAGIETESAAINSFDFYQCSWDELTIEEITEYYLLPQSGNTVLPAPNFTMEFAGSYRFKFQTFAYYPSLSTPDPAEHFVWPYLNVGGVEYAFTLKGGLPGFVYAEWQIDVTIDLLVGSDVRVYFRKLNDIPGGYIGTFRWNGTFVFASYRFESTAEIVAQTIYPQTRCKTFFQHDAGGSITDRLTSVYNSFYSEYLGGQTTNYRVYLSDGCAWNHILVKGLQLRDYSLNEKPFFLSFKQWWDGVSPIFNLGLGYDTISDSEVIRVEERAHFYNPLISVSFDYVFDIVRRYDNKSIFNKIDVGYSKWESEQISGIDDPQTKHTYATRLKKAGEPVNIESDFIAASLAIEETRRKTRKKSADYKLDNDVFIIAIKEVESSPDSYYPELDEDFNSVTNIQNPETRYNLKLTPARNLLRWLNVFNGCLQMYQDSMYKFVSGQGNYDMASDLIDTTPSCEHQTEVSEKQDIAVTDDYLHLPELFEINIPMEWEEYVTIRDNREKAIGISQTNIDHVAFFIKELDFEVCKSKARIVAWPKTPFQITLTDFVPPEQVCVPVPEPDISCDDAYLTEIGDELLTELEECLILE